MSEIVFNGPNIPVLGFLFGPYQSSDSAPIPHYLRFKLAPNGFNKRR
ncbi:MAG TPA: hypothetical protein VMY59_06855 [Candidatus Thermoplasmatota archaeon]|nr:hypothetical protein [Candidatus Thermoplasmatota archaeon]